MTTFSGSFSTTDKDATIRPKKDPVDEVIDILDQIGQDDFTAQAMSASPQVSIQQTDKLPMSPEQQAQAFRNLYGGGKSLGMYTGDTGFQEDIDFDVYNLLSPRPQDNLSGFQQASAPSLGNIYGDGRALGLYTPPQGIANVVPKVNMPSLDPGEAAAQIYRDMGPSLNPQAQAQGLGAINPYEQFGDNLLGGDASTVYGINPVVKRIAEFQGYDMDTDEGVRKYLADTQQTMEDSGDALEARRKDQDRALAAMLAAQQQQPVDPCPEGYRMDPVSRVCVPTDDTTEPVGITKRTYEAMTEPAADYTAKTDFTVPTVTLPNILTYE